VSFFDHLLRKFKLGKDVNGFHDITFSPIGIESLCFFIQAHLFTQTKGVVNVVGEQELTKLDFAIEVKKALVESRSVINSISIRDSGLASTRPAYMSLSNQRLIREFGFSPPVLSHMICQEIELAQSLNASSEI